jgi:alpha-tubulin suppressor-like RCC1 family protein
MIPNTNAARKPLLRFMSSVARRMRSAVVGWPVLAAALAAALCVAACSEPTASTRVFPVLDDIGSSDWASVTVGGDHTCALKTNGTAYCWGSNQYGQLGVTNAGTTCGGGNATYPCATTPQIVQAGLQFIAISAGQRHTCAITQAREAYCWGSNDGGQVSDFATGGPTLTKVSGTLPWTQISAGYTHSCAVRSDGILICWGSNDRGQLGNGSDLPGTTRVAMPASVASVTTGQSRTCARTTIGVVYCWGAIWTERSGGLELSRAQLTPQLVPTSPQMAWLTVGSFTTCGADASGFAYCWEANPRGEMGDGTQDGSTTPVRVASDLEFVQLSAGIVQTCGIDISGAGYCWGDDTFGELGMSPSLLVERCGGQVLPCATKPVGVVGRQKFVDIETGFGSHSCGVTTLGNLYCWGLGVSGQRGDGTQAGAVSTPALVVEPARLGTSAQANRAP